MGTYTNTSGQVEAYRPYSVVDGRLAWNDDTYSIYVEGNNLTSHRYTDYGNVPQPGFWLMVGAKYHIAL
jgi:iron complex outermembrane receptor protein